MKFSENFMWKLIYNKYIVEYVFERVYYVFYYSEERLKKNVKKFNLFLLCS